MTVFARRPGSVSHEKLDWRTVPMDRAEGVESDCFFCCFGTTIKKAGSREAFRRVDLEIPLAWARAAREAGTERASLVSSVGADVGSGNFYLATKGETERAFRDLRFPSLDVFRPSLLLGERTETRWGEILAEPFAKAVSPFLFGGLRRYRPIEASAVAAAMANAARTGGAGFRVHEFDGILRLNAP